MRPRTAKEWLAIGGYCAAFSASASLKLDPFSECSWKVYKVDPKIRTSVLNVQTVSPGAPGSLPPQGSLRGRLG